MKFYIASGLENAAAVREMREALEAQGHRCTYDWTVHGSVAGTGTDRLREVGHAELAGVLRAEILIVRLPGGKGTHFELGAAVAAGKAIVLWATEIEAFLFADDPRTCTFYHLDGIVKAVSAPARCAQTVAAAAPRALRMAGEARRRLDERRSEAERDGAASE